MQASLMPIPPVVDADQQPSSPARRSPRGAATAVALAALATIGAAALLARWLGDSALVLRTAALVGIGGAILLWLAARQLGAETFGAANSVTLVRAALTVLLVALLGVSPTPSLGWTLVGLGAAGVALDGFDGALARRRSEASAFGARFDMETDALLILVLAALVWQHGKAGVWILAAGLLRYAFVAASWAFRWLGSALPPSVRRQAVCVVQIVSLLGALVPAVVPPWSTALAGVGLAALVWSFAIDVHWLAGHTRS
jgi:phosphatidylglycerophosphate synthase